MKIKQKELHIQRRLEKLEIFTSIETKNKYEIMDNNGKALYFAFEESNFFARNFLKRARPMRIKIIGQYQEPLIEIKKNFSIAFPKFEIYENDHLIGKIKCKFLGMAKLDVFDAQDRLVYTSKNTIRHPWVFNIQREDDGLKEQTIAKISRKYNGLGKLVFTDANAFHIDYMNLSSDIEKTLILALSFAIDLAIFER